jgi:peptidyl-dipeptidase Dcp
MFFTCSTNTDSDSNPFYTEYDTPFGTPPFSEIKLEHYMPAFKDGMEQENKEIDAIANNSETPTFENTIVAMEKTGELLDRVNHVFYNLNSSMTNEDMQAIAKDLSPLLSKHRDDIRLNEILFERVKAVYEQKDDLQLNTEQKMLLDKYYKSFIRGGANLDETKKGELREINKELSLLTLQFGENILKENNRFEMVLENKADLAGLTKAVITAAAETGKERGHEGKWVFTLHKPSLIPFLQYSEKRELREKMFKGYINRGDNNDDLDTKAMLSKIAALRVRRANLLGYKTHAAFILDENMAKNADNLKRCKS